MDNKIRSLKETQKEIKAQGFKHIRLTDLGETVICAYNPSHAKAATNLTKKWSEIETRLKMQNAGIYIIQARQRFSGGEPTYNFYVGNKNYNPADLNNKPEPQTKEKPEEKLKEQPRSNVEKLLSVDTAMNYASENARLTAENDQLRNQVADLKSQNAELLAELEESDEKGLTVGDENKVTKSIESIMGIALPVADRFMDYLDKKEERQKMKLLSDAGYEIPGHTRKTNGNKTTHAPAKRDFNANIPTQDMPDWDDYLNWLGELGDEDFSTHLEKVETADKNIYEAICKEFDVSFEE